MVKIAFVTTDQQTIETEATEGQSLMEVAIEASVDGIPGDCGGCCSCATCHIKVPVEWQAKLQPAETDEIDMLECAEGADDSSRLACQIIVNEEMNGLTVMVGSPG